MADADPYLVLTVEQPQSVNSDVRQALSVLLDLKLSLYFLNYAQISFKLLPLSTQHT